MTAHGRLKARIIAHLRQDGWYATSVVIGSRNGVPDIVACVDGRAVAVEVKVGKDRLSPLQRVEADRWRRAGGIYIEARSVEDVTAGLRAAARSGAPTGAAVGD